MEALPPPSPIRGPPWGGRIAHNVGPKAPNMQEYAHFPLNATRFTCTMQSANIWGRGAFGLLPKKQSTNAVHPNTGMAVCGAYTRSAPGRHEVPIVGEVPIFGPPSPQNWRAKAFPRVHGNVSQRARKPPDPWAGVGAGTACIGHVYGVRRLHVFVHMFFCCV